MSSHELTGDGLFQLLLEIDKDIATEARAGGCAQCGGKKFHCGDFPRKPRGCPQRFLAAYSRRTSLDCATCRHRTTPASVRFLPHRVYLAAVVLLMSTRRSLRGHWLARELEVPRRTVERWRHWWRHKFVKTPLWQSLRGRLLPVPTTETLPGSLLQRLEGADPTERLVRLLRLLTPLHARAASA